MTQWLNELDIYLQTFHKELLHALNDLKRNPRSQDMHMHMKAEVAELKDKLAQRPENKDKPLEQINHVRKKIKKER